LIADDFSAELSEGLAYVAGHDDESRPVLVNFIILILKIYVCWIWMFCFYLSSKVCVIWMFCIFLSSNVYDLNLVNWLFTDFPHEARLSEVAFSETVSN